MKNYNLICEVLSKEISQDEKDKRRRMLKRAALLGVTAGALVTAGELGLNASARASLKKAFSKPGIKQKLFGAAKGVEGTVGHDPGGVVRQIAAPMALGIGADLVVDPAITHLNQRAEDRIEKKKRVR